MKTYLGSIAVAVAVSMLLAVPSANARGGGGGGGFGGGFGGGGGSHGGVGFAGGSHGAAVGFSHDGGRSGEGRGCVGWGGLGHGHHFGHGCYGFYDFWPDFGYDWWPPYYYDDYYDYYGYPPYYYDNAMPVSPTGLPPDYPQSDQRDYLMLGHDAGKALRLKSVSRDWLVDYLRAYIISAPLDARGDFRRGFVAGYGDSAMSVLKNAIQDARHPKPQSNTLPASNPVKPAM